MGSQIIKKRSVVIAIDPGISGAILATNGDDFLEVHSMPVVSDGKNKQVSFDGVHLILKTLAARHGTPHVFLERAVPMAMGAKGAFSYGRGFEAIVIAVRLTHLPVTHVEPSKWTREMMEGISIDLRPKARALIAVERLYPRLVGQLPKKPKGGLQDGPIDALLIAGYGLRKHCVESDTSDDFF